MRDEKQCNKRAEIAIALTAKAEQLQEVLDDFQNFLRTVRPASQDEADGGQT